MKAVIIGCLGVSLLAGCGGGGDVGEDAPEARNRTLTINGVYTNLCGLDVPAEDGVQIILHDESGNYITSTYLVEGQAELETGATANISIVPESYNGLVIMSYLQVPVASGGSTFRAYIGKIVGGGDATSGCNCTSYNVTGHASSPMIEDDRFYYALPDGAEQLDAFTPYQMVQYQPVCSVAGQPASGTTLLAGATADGEVQWGALDHSDLDGAGSVELDLMQTTASSPYSGNSDKVVFMLYGTDGSYADWTGSDGSIQIPDAAVAGIRMARFETGNSETEYVDGSELTRYSTVYRIGDSLDALEEQALPTQQLEVSSVGDDLFIQAPTEFGADLQRSVVSFSSPDGSYFYQLVISPALTSIPTLELTPELEQQAADVLAAAGNQFTMWLQYLNIDSASNYRSALELMTSPAVNRDHYQLSHQSLRLELTFVGGLTERSLLPAPSLKPNGETPTQGDHPHQPLLRRINGQQMLIQR